VLGAWWRERLGGEPPAFDNGAGLSRDVRVTARQLVRLLQYGWSSAVMPEFVASLPIVAVDGTMKKRLKAEPVAGQAHIKTGMLRDVRAMAGYVLARDGRRYTVVMIVNYARATETDPAMDALLEAIYDGAFGSNATTGRARARGHRPGASPPRP
jgi:D-alanyl-D-alanine carboxypeptidase/D-alanyl-D-alanine-endopeptidase (penicillin-binding protein 4)